MKKNIEKKDSIKNIYDFFIYSVKLKYKDFNFLIIDLLIFTVITIEIFTREYSDLLTTIMIFSFGRLLYSGIKLIQKINSIFFNPDMKTTNSNNLYIEDYGMTKVGELECSHEESYFSFKNDVIQTKDGEQTVSYSPQFNSKLYNSDLKLIINEAKSKQVKEFISSNRAILFDFLKTRFYEIRKTKIFQNDRKLCLSDDIDFIKNEVTCHKNGYFDSYLTNEISTKRLKKIGSDETFYDGTVFYPVTLPNKKKPCIKSITDSLINNHIGISTIVFTSDYYIQIWRQSENALIGAGQLTATGSGSCDYNDVQANNFNATIKYAMERELTEESQDVRNYVIKKGDIKDTKIIGYFRWLNRGGKPEFVGISKLAISHKKLHPNLNETHLPSNLEGNGLFLIRSIDELENLYNEISYKEKLSVPLTMILKLLKEYNAEHKGELQKFLFE